MGLRLLRLAEIGDSEKKGYKSKIDNQSQRPKIQWLKKKIKRGEISI